MLVSQYLVQTYTYRDTVQQSAVFKNNAVSVILFHSTTLRRRWWESTKTKTSLSNSTWGSKVCSMTLHKNYSRTYHICVRNGHTNCEKKQKSAYEVSRWTRPPQDVEDFGSTFWRHQSLIRRLCSQIRRRLCDTLTRVFQNFFRVIGEFFAFFFFANTNWRFHLSLNLL